MSIIQTIAGRGWRQPVHRRVSSLAALLFVALVTGCGDCTSKGCHSGLEVRLDRTPTRPFRIEASTGGSEPKYVFDCPNIALCGGGAFFSDFVPRSVRIRVIVARDAAVRDTVTRDFSPTYRKSQPNGSSCGPTCHQGTVDMPVPGPM